MERSVNAEVRAALRDANRVGVAISSGASGKGLRILIGAVAEKGSGSNSAPSSSVARAGPFSDRAKIAPLTPRECQVLRLIAKGLHNRQIAKRIHRSIKTVEKHRQNIHVKLSTHEVAGLTRQALAMGLLDKTSPAAARLANAARQLTPRELEVLKLVAQGSGNKWIASELRRSIKTIDHHRENIMKKLGIHEVAGLTLHALAIGLL
jgi:DNA-binding NarL/FixJ family response regulator